MHSSAFSYSSGPALEIMSTGFRVLDSSGRKLASFLLVSSESVAMRRHSFTAASVARIAGPPAFERMHSRSPFGIGFVVRARATSIISSMVDTRMTPH